MNVDGTLKTGRLGQGHYSRADRAESASAAAPASVFEYTGSAIRALTMEERMTVCNMSIEGGARAGLIAPDDTTFQYLAGRPHGSARAPIGMPPLARWKQLPTDEGATYDRSLSIDADALEPMITYGTNPGHGHVDHCAAARAVDDRRSDRSAIPSTKALQYMGLEGGKPLVGHPIDVVFHRKLHQLAHQRSADGGRPAEGPQGESQGSRDGGAGIAGSEAPG